jgi:hypothetical protein
VWAICVPTIHNDGVGFRFVLPLTVAFLSLPLFQPSIRHSSYRSRCVGACVNRNCLPPAPFQLAPYKTVT